MVLKREKRTGIRNFILGFILMIGMISTEKIYAASFSELNANTMFFKQNTTSTCTLASSAMMIRRAALLSGNGNWEGVTENALRSVAWAEGSGLRNSFSYEGMQISSEKISSNRSQTMMNLLHQHPEGIVIYDFEKPHAILLTDYTDGIFYCADPSSAAPNGRIPISQATITIESIDKYWYVSSPKFEIGADDSKLAEGCFFDESTGKLTITEDFNWAVIDDGEDKNPWWTEWEQIGLKKEEVVVAEIDLTGTKRILENGVNYCTFRLNEFTNLETVSFTGSIDTRPAISLWGLFEECIKLKNVDFSGFSDANITDISSMFYGCSSLRGIDLSNLNTTNVTQMGYMFGGCSELESLDLSKFHTANVRWMAGMFYGCSSLKSLDLRNFNTLNVTEMQEMFSNCNSLIGLNLSSFNTSNVDNMYGMFSDCSSLTNLDLSSFNTSNVTDMYEMFQGCSLLKSLDLSNFDTSNVGAMSHMFHECSLLESLDLSHFDTSSATTMEGMFWGCSSLKKIDIRNFDTSNVSDMDFMFYKCSLLENLDLSHFDTSNAYDMGYMFCGCSSLKNLNLSHFDSSKVQYMRGMFDNCSLLENLDLSRFNTYEVTDMKFMFHGCSSLKNLDVSAFNTCNVTDMNCMFAYCISLENLDLSNFNTQNVTNMSQMFDACIALKNVDVSGFDTSNVTDMAWMFCDNNSLESLDVSGFNTKNVLDMDHMFFNCTSLKNIDVRGFNTSNVMDMRCMFYGCRTLSKIDISGFNTSNVVDMDVMFSWCNALKEIDISNFDFGKTEIDNGKMLFNVMDNIEQIIVPADLPYALQLPYSSTIPDNMESYWVNTSGKECSEIQAGLSVPMTYSRRLRTVTNPSAKYLAKGKTFTDSKTNCKFKVTSSPAENPTVAFAGVTKKSKKITIPSVVTYQGITCQVTSVSAKALKGNTKIKSLIIGSNITRIEKKAFEGCKNLKKITVETEKLNFVGKNALKGIHKKCRIKVPSSNLKTYRKLFRKKGQKSTVKITK